MRVPATKIDEQGRRALRANTADAVLGGAVRAVLEHPLDYAKAVEAAKASGEDSAARGCVAGTISGLLLGLCGRDTLDRLTMGLELRDLFLRFSRDLYILDESHEVLDEMYPPY